MTHHTPAEIQEISLPLSHSAIIQAQAEILSKLEDHYDDFVAIRNSDASIIVRWGQLIQMILPIQIEVINKLGYENGQEGLSAYNEALSAAIAKSPKIKEQNEMKWSYLMETAFGVRETRDISLEEARELVEAISEAVTSEEFLQEIEVALSDLPAGVDHLLPRRKKLLDLLLVAQMEVFAQYDFEGELGYVKAQKALLPHYNDPYLAKLVHEAQNILFKRAKLTEQ